MQESLVFLILGVDRLREDQLIYVETRENVFFYDMGPLNGACLHASNACFFFFAAIALVVQEANVTQKLCRGLTSYPGDNVRKFKLKHRLCLSCANAPHEKTWWGNL